MQKASGWACVSGGGRCPKPNWGLAGCTGRATSGKWGCLCHRCAPPLLSWLFNYFCSV